jgi:pSer/pThr/pTyr-binding forkhead associated (FHA) protein
MLYAFLVYTLVQMFRILKFHDHTLEHSGYISNSDTGLTSLNRGNEAEAQLVKVKDGELSRIYPVKGSIYLGRDSGNHIVIADPKASRRHARIYENKGQYWIEDLGSKNGVFLNDIKVSGPVVLADRDTLRIGNVTFVFVRWGHEVEQSNTRGAGTQC